MFFRGAGFGAGAVLVLSLIFGAVVWYRSRPLPWNDHALSATFDTIGFNTQPKETSYIVEFCATSSGMIACLAYLCAVSGLDLNDT